jgi:hypothetical protein
MQREPFLSALSYRGFPVLEEWAQMERTALGNVWRSAALKAAIQHETAGQSGLACDTLLRLLRGGEAEEDAVQALLRVAGSAGRSEEALEQYERLRAELHEGAGAEPAPRTVALADALRDPARSPSGLAASSAAVPRGVSHPPRLVGRGARRLSSTPGLPSSSSPASRAWARRACSKALPNARYVARREELGQRRSAYRRADRGSATPPSRCGKTKPAVCPAFAAASSSRPPSPALAATARRDRGVRSACRTGVFDDLRADASTLELVVFMARRSTLRSALRTAATSCIASRGRARRDRCRRDRRARAPGPALGVATDRAAGRGQPGRYRTAALLRLVAPPHGGNPFFRCRPCARSSKADSSRRSRTAGPAPRRITTDYSS